MNILYSRCRKIWEKFGFFATFFLLKEVAFSQIWKSLNGSHSLPRSVHCERSQIRTRDICVSSLEWHQGATTTPIYFTYCILIFVLVSIKRKCYMTVTHIVQCTCGTDTMDNYYKWLLAMGQKVSRLANFFCQLLQKILRSFIHKENLP